MSSPEVDTKRGCHLIARFESAPAQFLSDTDLYRSIVTTNIADNPQRIVIASIDLRQRLEAAVHEIVPAGLGEQIGDYAALAVARYDALL